MKCTSGNRMVVPERYVVIRRWRRTVNMPERHDAMPPVIVKSMLSFQWKLSEFDRRSIPDRPNWSEAL
jgi:hypothetical protein